MRMGAERGAGDLPLAQRCAAWAAALGGGRGFGQARLMVCGLAAVPSGQAATRTAAVRTALPHCPEGPYRELALATHSGVLCGCPALPCPAPACLCRLATPGDVVRVCVHGAQHAHAAAGLIGGWLGGWAKWPTWRLCHLGVKEGGEEHRGNGPMEGGGHAGEGG